MQFFINHIYIFLTIFFSVSSQLIIKWKMSAFSIDTIGNTLLDKFIFASSMLLNPYIMVSIIFTLLSGLSWMIAMTKFEISYAYPFTILGFVMVLFISNLFFDESITINKIFGILFIGIGIFIISKEM